MLNKNVEVFMGCDTGWHFASTVLFGAPFDSTTSYRPGTRFGSGAIRRESYGIESYSPYQDRDLLDGDVVDIGDIELCFGDSAAALESITQQTRWILASHKRPFMLGGEHLVTLGAFRAVAEKFPDVHIIHFDAHADLRDDYLGVPLSHACVMRRCWELVGNGRIFQFGIRSGRRAASSSSASARATGRSFPGDAPTSEQTALTSIPWRRLSSSCRANRSTSPSTWMCWIRRSFPAPAPRNRAASALRN